MCVCVCVCVRVCVCALVIAKANRVVSVDIWFRESGARRVETANRFSGWLASDTTPNPPPPPPQAAVLNTVLGKFAFRDKVWKGVQYWSRVMWALAEIRLARAVASGDTTAQVALKATYSQW
jgi:hypothetical protein